MGIAIRSKACSRRIGRRTTPTCSGSPRPSNRGFTRDLGAALYDFFSERIVAHLQATGHGAPFQADLFRGQPVGNQQIQILAECFGALRNCTALPHSEPDSALQWKASAKNPYPYCLERLSLLIQALAIVTAGAGDAWDSDCD